MNKKPDEILHDLATVFKIKNSQYKDNYKANFGKVMLALFPDGVDLKTEIDFIRFGIFTNIIYKLTRYSPRWYEGGHEDSMVDLPVYAAMLQEIDNSVRQSNDKTVFKANNFPGVHSKEDRQSFQLIEADRPD